MKLALLAIYPCVPRKALQIAPEDVNCKNLTFDKWVITICFFWAAHASAFVSWVMLEYDTSGSDMMRWTDV